MDAHTDGASTDPAQAPQGSGSADLGPAGSGPADVQMAEATAGQVDEAQQNVTPPDSDPTPPQPPPQPQTTSEPAAAPSPVPVKNGTPGQVTSAGAGGSRGPSAHPDHQAAFQMPAQAAPHGAPVRQYLNSKVTAHLLEGLKKVAKEQPTDPLRALGEYLIQKSEEFEKGKGVA